MAAYLAVCPVKHGIDPNLKRILADLELTLDLEPVQGSLDYGFRIPGAVVGDYQVFAHESFGFFYLSLVLAKAHLVGIKGQVIVLTADVQIFTELLVSVADSFLVAPFGFMVVVLSLELHEFGPDTIKLPGQVM